MADTIGPVPALLDAIEVLRQNLYVSLAEHQAEQEAASSAERVPGRTGLGDCSEHPLADEIRDPRRPIPTPIDLFYGQIVWSLGRYTIALLKILGCCHFEVKKDADASFFDSELVQAPPDAQPKSRTPLEVAERVQDSERLKETMVKAVTSALLLLLKHFRTQHVYQAESFAMALVDGEAIALMLKILSKDLGSFVSAETGVPELELSHVLLLQATGPDAVAPERAMSYNHRNFIASTNLLRILQKLTKGRQTRVLQLVFHKSHLILKQCLKVSPASHFEISPKIVLFLTQITLN